MPDVLGNPRHLTTSIQDSSQITQIVSSSQGCKIQSSRVVLYLFRKTVCISNEFGNLRHHHVLPTVVCLTLWVRARPFVFFYVFPTELSPSSPLKSSTSQGLRADFFAVHSDSMACPAESRSLMTDTTFMLHFSMHLLPRRLEQRSRWRFGQQKKQIVLSSVMATPVPVESVTHVASTLTVNECPIGTSQFLSSTKWQHVQKTWDGDLTVARNHERTPFVSEPNFNVWCIVLQLSLHWTVTESNDSDFMFSVFCFCMRSGVSFDVFAIRGPRRASVKSVLYLICLLCRCDLLGISDVRDLLRLVLSDLLELLDLLLSWLLLYSSTSLSTCLMIFRVRVFVLNTSTHSHLVATLLKWSDRSEDSDIVVPKENYTIISRGRTGFNTTFIRHPSSKSEVT